jgi:hypothetical protein
MTQLYCGNNKLDKRLETGTHRIGSNYECLKKGIGTGLHMPYDPSYADPYSAIDIRKFYCGKMKKIPREYFDTGSPSICLRTGIGIGLSQRAKKGPDNNLSMKFSSSHSQKYFPFILLIIINITILCVLYYAKPSFVTKTDKSHRISINKTKFAVYYLLFFMITCIIFYFYQTFSHPNKN